MAEQEADTDGSPRGCRRSRSFSSADSVYGSECKRRHSPASSSLSVTSDPGSGNVTVESVSYWLRQRVENLGIFYAREAIDIAEFYKISEKCPFDGWFAHPFTGKNKHILESLIKFSKEKLKKTAEFGRVLTAKLKEDLEHIRESAKLCEKILNDIENSDIEENDSLVSWYQVRSRIKMEDFFAELLLFFSMKLKGEDIAERDFTLLLSKFLEIFLLNVHPAPKKRVMEINGVQTASVPDLQLINLKLHQLPNTIGVVGVNEKKLKTPKKGKSGDRFKIQGVINDRILGEHAGELLLERQGSVFGSAVLGVLCMQTSIIFTWLEISQAHVDKIIEYGKVEEKMKLDDKDNKESKSKDSGTIYYTKPYDYMNVGDLEEVMEFLFWLGLQSLPGKHCLQQEQEENGT